ncbi:helix-turn-helix domain-containing protein [Rhodococcus oryzae]|uniref:helix-turn-helix domain-containing protein n=1 Tax=Rhodococcus oryzae TaxID=2571143 RepID=UPI00379F5058
MFVMTVDQRGSRRDVDRVDPILREFADAPLLRPFERTAGDEVQAVADRADVVVDLALELAARGHWSVGIGVGPVESPLPASTRAGRGQAFEAARDAVDRAKNLPGSVAVTGPDAPSAADAETALMLVSVLVSRRSEPGRDAVAAMREGLTQAEAAERLGISKQAISQRLAVAGWQAECAGRALALRLLQEAAR